jgi:hypothetical protein
MTRRSGSKFSKSEALTWLIPTRCSQAISWNYLMIGRTMAKTDFVFGAISMEDELAWFGHPGMVAIGS